MYIYIFIYIHRKERHQDCANSNVSLLGLYLLVHLNVSLAFLS